MKKAIVLGVISLLCLPVILLAEETWDGDIAQYLKGDIGPEVSYIEYKEPDVMKETGVMYGLSGYLAYRNGMMLKADGRFSYGQVDYKNSGTLDNINDYIFEFRGLGGYDFPMFETVTLTPYAGLGYRYLNDDLSGKTTSTGASGYERESNYLYSPIGVEGLIPMDNGWSIGATAEYDIFWHGWQKSHLSDANANFNDVDNDQKKGYGLRGSVRIKKAGEKLGIVIEPFVRYWNIAKSEDSNVTYSGVIVGYGYEPKNNSTEVGCRVGMTF